MKNVKVIRKGAISKAAVLKRWGQWGAPVATPPALFSTSFAVWIKKLTAAEGTALSTAWGTSAPVTPWGPAQLLQRLELRSSLQGAPTPRHHPLLRGSSNVLPS